MMFYNLKQKHDKPTSMKESRFFQDYLLQVLVSLQELVLLDLPFPTRKSATFKKCKYNLVNFNQIIL